MTGRQVPCRHCGGKGHTEHRCERSDLVIVEMQYTIGCGHSRESLGVYRCTVCEQLWKIRYQYDAGTGSDDIWLKPGEAQRGYHFSEEESARYGGE